MYTSPMRRLIPLLLIYVIVHSVNGDQAITYGGMDQAAIASLLSREGKTGDFVDQATYDAFVVAHTPVPLTPAEINLQQRDSALYDLLTNADGLSKLQRSVLMTLFDENNVTREWLQAFKGQVAAATSLADLKTRVATLPDMPDRTVQQAKTAVQNKINSGAPD